MPKNLRKHYNEILFQMRLDDDQCKTRSENGQWQRCHITASILAIILKFMEKYNLLGIDMVPMRIRQNDHESDQCGSITLNTGQWHEMVLILLTVPTYVRCTISISKLTFVLISRDTNLSLV